MLSTKKLVTFAMLSAMASVAMLVFRIHIMPTAPFLTYDLKDVIIVIGGFLYGPVAAALITIVVSWVEMLTVSDAGYYGMIMNITSSAALTCTAAAVYRYKRSLAGAVIGLATGIASVTSVMLLWNYIITPIYTGLPRTVVAGMLIPVFLPFNLIKATLNSAIVLLLYKPVVSALRKAGLYELNIEQVGKINKGLIMAAGFVIISLVLVIWVLRS